MASLIINDYTVAISAAQPPKRTDTEYGDYTQAIDGTDRGVVIGTKWLWTVVTKPIAQSDADAMLTAILSGPALTASGTLLGTADSYTVRCQMTNYEPVTTKGDYLVVVTFTVRQS